MLTMKRIDLTPPNPDLTTSLEHERPEVLHPTDGYPQGPRVDEVARADAQSRDYIVQRGHANVPAAAGHVSMNGSFEQPTGQ